MKAAILTQLGAPLVLADLEMPERLNFGQVHVQIQYSTICGAQIGEIAGVKGPDKFLPHCLGHEAVGKVLAVGDGVKTVEGGDTVILHWRPSNGIQSDPPVYNWPGHTSRVNAGWVTTFQEHAIVSENRCTKLPEGIAHKVAPLFGCALTTAYGVIVNDAQVKPGDSVLIYGVGGVGLPMVRMALAAGARVVGVVDPIKSKVEAAYRAGASSVQPELFDVAIDTTGKSSAIEACYRRTTPKGKVILVGVPRHDDPIRIDSLPLHFGKVLTGSQGGNCEPHLDIPRIANLMRSGQLNFDGLVTHEYPLEQINAALDLVRSGQAGRVLLRMS